jgi:hypothetical protein
MAREKLCLYLAGAYLIYTDVYRGVMEDVVSGMYVGREMVRGEVCEHVAFRGKEVDFQIWIRAGDTPTPCRYVITTTSVKGHPGYAVNLTGWDLSPQLDDAAFTFRPPEGAEQIDFLTADEFKKRSEGRRKAKKEVGR